MLELGLAPYIGLPAVPDTAEFQRVCGRMATVQEPQPITLLAGLLSECSED